jgi:DNA-binding CsgD family transcriptional regulator
MNAAIDKIEALETLRALPVSAAILDASGKIVAVNDTWKELGRRNRLRIPRFGIGANYLQYCGSEEPQASRFASDLQNLLAGRLDSLTLIYPCHSRSENRWFCLIGLPLSLNEPAGVALLHVDFTAMILHSLAAPPRFPAHSGARGRVTDDLGAIGGAIKQSAAEALSAQLSSMLAGASESAPTHHDRERVIAAARLSRREMQILRLLGKGKTNKEIADLLFRSPNTIKLHVSSILRGLKVKSRTQAALLASRLNEDEPLTCHGGRPPQRGATRSMRGESLPES